MQVDICFPNLHSAASVSEWSFIVLYYRDRIVNKSGVFAKQIEDQICLQMSKRVLPACSQVHQTTLLIAIVTHQVTNLVIHKR